MDDEYAVLIEQDDDGVFIATVPALRGCHTAGDAEEEAPEMARDAIRLYLEHPRATGRPIPREVGTTNVRVAVPARVQSCRS
jgi:predicted RNase H-like HicB family nuclease